MRVKRTDFHLPTAEHSSQPVIARLGAKKLSKFRHLLSSTFHLPRLWRSLTATRRRRVASGALSALIVGTIILQALPAGAAPATVRQEINIINKTYTATNAALTSDEIVQLDTTAYSGTVSYYFEVVANTTAASTGNIALRRSGTTTNDATIALSTVGTSYTRYRTSAFTAPAGQTQYVLYADAAGASKTLNIKAARIIISQTSDPITATETQIEIGNHETGKNNTTAAPLNNPKYWKYTAANWNPAPTFYAEVTYKATIGTTPVTNTYTSLGTTSMQYPAGVTQVTVEAWGGGGGGGSQASVSGASGGGGGGAFASGTVNITEGASYTHSVGGGGGAGIDGSPTFFGPDANSANAFVRAASGLAGQAGNASLAGPGGAGGLASNSVGNIITRNGGNGRGVYSNPAFGGGGGGGAGTNNVGTSATAQAGGAGGTVDGGSGGAGAANGNGVAGNAFGGGGGGSHRTNGNRTGGAGANGKISISYNQPAVGHSVTIILQEDDGNFGNWTNVTNGTLVTGGTAASPTRVRMASGFTPVDGRHYRIASSITNAASSYEVLAGKIIARSGWREVQPAGNVNLSWISADSSADGSVILAASNGSRLYRSINGGLSWSEVQPAGNVNINWQEVAISSNGQTMIAAAYNGRMYRSIDTGINWTEMQPLGNGDFLWISLAVSGDGTRMLAGTSGSLSLSNNGGDTWNNISSSVGGSTSYNVSAVSSDGTTLLAGGTGGILYISKNGGVDWNSTSNGIRNWRTAAINSDGMTLLAAASNGRMFRSTNNAVSWTEATPAGATDLNWRSLAVTDSGSRMIAAVLGGRLYQSIDSGANWNELTPLGNTNQNWTTVTAASTNYIFLAGVNTGRLYQYIQTTSNIKFESQYLLANTSVGASTGLKDYDTHWDPAEWSNVNNTYYHESNGTSPAWNEAQPNGNVSRDWGRALATNASGQFQLAGIDNATNGRLYLTSNGGSSWAEVQPAGNINIAWKSAAISSSGDVMVAGNSSRLYRSTNGGANWSEIQPVGNINKHWSNIAISGDGLIVYATNSTDSRLHRTTDGGVNWEEVTPSPGVSRGYKVSMSLNGQYLLAGINSNTGRLYVSMNAGSTWSEAPTIGETDDFWDGFGVSEDGSVMIACQPAGSGRIYKSLNGGSTWSEANPLGNTSQYWLTCSLSGNGNVMMAGVGGGGLYKSSDRGTSWTHETPAGLTSNNWRTTALNKDGSRILAGYNGINGRLYNYTVSASVKLQSNPNTSPSDINVAELMYVNEVKRTSTITMPVTATDIDVNVTAIGTVNASRIVVVVDTNTNATPIAPTLSAPANAATGVSTTPSFQLSSTDTESDYLRYRIEVCTTSNCSVVLRTIDQTSSQTGWSGQNAQTNTAYTSGTTASHTYQAPALSGNTQYWWRASARDPAGSGTWSTLSSIYSFTTLTPNVAPTAPTLVAPTDFASNLSTTPTFQLSSTDSNGDYLRYRIEICDDSECTTVLRTIDQTSSQTGWSGQNTQTNTAYTSGTTASHALQTPAFSYATPYSWRAYAIDPAGSNTWSTASAIYNFSTELDGGDPPPESSDTYLRGGVRIRGGTRL